MDTFSFTFQVKLDTGGNCDRAVRPVEADDDLPKFGGGVKKS